MEGLALPSAGSNPLSHIPLPKGKEQEGVSVSTEEQSTYVPFSHHSQGVSVALLSSLHHGLQ